MDAKLRRLWAAEPMRFKHALWPEVEFYDKQIDIIHSVRDDPETFVTAGNMLGKDFVAGFVILWYFLCHHPVKIITTSANEKHLATLWGEVDRFIRTAAVPLRMDRGGILKYNHLELYKFIKGELYKDSYVKGMVVSNPQEGEALAGHHSANTLFVCDEASGVDNVAYSMAQGWAKHMLIIGNPNACTNFFYHGVKGGTIEL
jgi:hypothetical protein